MTTTPRKEEDHPRPPPQPPQQTPEQQKTEQERLAQAREEFARREKDNNPATRTFRQYENINQPGLDPHNQPDPDSKIRKGTRLDLEDITGNPGHRGVNPDAPATSINHTMPDQRDNPPSINEPPGVEPAPRAVTLGLTSINEPPGSNVRPELQQSQAQLQAPKADKDKAEKEEKEKKENKEKDEDEDDDNHKSRRR